MTYRNRKLLDLAHQLSTCLVQGPTCIGHEPNGLQPAHANWSYLGRGIGHKSGDVFAASCRACHAYIDGSAPRAEREYWWLRGAAKTWLTLMERQWLVIADSKTTDQQR